MNRTNYIFIDFENVQKVDLDMIAGKPVVVILVLGLRHTSLPLDLVKKLLKHATQVRLVETAQNGRNALDFVLAYHVGVQSVADPKSYFHILSRDKGFDALILHLKENHILAGRHETFAKIPVLVDVARVSLADQVKTIIERFTKNQTNRPKRKKTLLSQIHAHFAKRLAEGEVQAILDALIARKVVEITPEGAVVYRI